MKCSPCFCSTQELNTTAQAFRSLHRELIMGAPATDERMALQKITDLCIIRGWKRSRKLWIIEVVLYSLCMSMFDLTCLSAFRCSPGSQKSEEILQLESLLRFEVVWQKWWATTTSWSERVSRSWATNQTLWAPWIKLVLQALLQWHHLLVTSTISIKDSGSESLQGPKFERKIEYDWIRFNDKIPKWKMKYRILMFDRFSFLLAIAAIAMA